MRPNPYAKVQAQTATPQRLMVLLFERALRDVRQGTQALEEGRRPDAAKLWMHAAEILVELHATLDTRHAPELAETLGELYRWICARLARAAGSYDVSAAREAERALTPVVEAFAAAVGAPGAEVQP